MTQGPVVDLRTTMGAMAIELDPDKAPVTTGNFLEYVAAGFYDGLIFHRVIADFMIQGGGFNREFERADARPPIQNEADNGLPNLRGTIAMARTGDPHSAAAQFFVNLKDNAFLDHQAKTPKGWGYAVFGRVIEGMDVVDRIGATDTGRCGPFESDCPLEAVVIESATVRADEE